VLYHADVAGGSSVSQAKFVQEFPLTDWIKIDNLFKTYKVGIVEAESAPAGISLVWSHGLGRGSLPLRSRLPTTVHSTNERLTRRLDLLLYSMHTEKVSLLYILAEDNMSDLIRSHPSILSCLEVERSVIGHPFLRPLRLGVKMLFERL
jgi:hypothetical protein